MRLGPGKIAGEALEHARATFSGSKVDVESIDVRLAAGHVVASGNFTTTTKAFDFQGKAEGVDLSRLTALSNRPGTPAVTGIADFTAHIVGNLSQADFSSYQITFDGQGRDVTINGKPTGTLGLVGRTENKQLSITLTSGLLGQPQVIAAKINLAGERLPATVETTLTNADLTKLLSIVLPSTTVRVSGLARNDQRRQRLLNEDGYFSIAGLTGSASFSELN